MTQSQHTKGPWTVLPNVSGTGYIISGKRAQGFGPIAEVIIFNGENNGLTDLANIQLIANAPELLEAAQNARNAIAALVVGDLKASDFTNDSPSLNSLRKAIKKAKGDANA